MKLNDGQDEAWEELEKKVSIGDKLTGTIVHGAGMYPWADAELGFPAMIENILIDQSGQSDQYKIGSLVQFIVTELRVLPRIIIAEVNPSEELEKKLKEWVICKQRFKVGQIVNGVVRAKTHFGYFLDLDGNNLGLVKTIDIADFGRVTMEDMPDKGAVVECVVLGFTDSSRQVVLSAKPSALERARNRGAKF